MDWLNYLYQNYVFVFASGEGSDAENLFFRLKQVFFARLKPRVRATVFNL